MATPILGALNNRSKRLHWNPVKHGWAKQVADWPYSSFHHYVKLGVYPLAWGHADEFGLDAGE